MKKILLPVLAVLVSIAATAQKSNEKIEGNGKLVTREVSVSSFDILKASGVYQLKLSQGTKESVKIEADENLQEYFTVKNEGSKLIIDMKKLENKSLNVKNKMTIHVTFRTLKEMDLSTVGSVNAEAPLKFDDLKLSNKSVGNVGLQLTANKLDIKNNSVGNVRLSGIAQNAVVKNNGVGKLEAGELVVQTMDIENSGVGNAVVNAEKELKVKDSFLGKVTNKGNAPVRKMNKVRV